MKKVRGTVFAGRMMRMGAVLVLLVTAVACRKTAVVPEVYETTGEAMTLFPDYTDIALPPNIAPLNFWVRNEGKAFVAHIEGRSSSLTVAATGGGKVIMDAEQWQALLAVHKGDSLTVTVYAEGENGWRRLLPCKWYVTPEPVDSFLSYRLIEPGYEIYRRLGLYQRNLTNFDVQTIYENNRVYDDKNNHCINCHNYQNYDTSNMLFHVRANHGGTLIGSGGKLVKLNLKNDSLVGGAVYPSWHPERKWIAFSSNLTGQSFHIKHEEKIEVMDMASDLIFYDHEKGTVRNIMRTDSVLETFPHWHPDGKRLFYTAAYLPEMKGLDRAGLEQYTFNNYKKLRYDVMYMDFDTETQQFGEPQMLVPCAAEGKSAAVARVSPDGRYLLYTLADYGQFHIWHKAADLWVYDLQTGYNYPLKEANSDDADSYHSWSSNGRWVAFSSRRGDGNYTRIYLAYFDTDGRSRKAFMIPQPDPEQNVLLLKSYNVPELTRNAVPFMHEDFERAVYNQEACPVQLVSR